MRKSRADGEGAETNKRDDEVGSASEVLAKRSPQQWPTVQRDKNDMFSAIISLRNKSRTNMQYPAMKSEMVRVPTSLEKVNFFSI